MADFNVRADSVDVEQIMERVRTRIAEKRGTDYTEDQVREIATVRLEKSLDPRIVRSDLLETFRQSRPQVEAEYAAFEAACTFNEETLFATHRGSLRMVRRLLMPIFKLFFNPASLTHVLQTQSNLNVALLTRSAKWNALQFEVTHNLVVETTRMSIELKNLRMRVDALSSRLDFSERRARALEEVVQYRQDNDAVRNRDQSPADASSGGGGDVGSLRRRRRRARRWGGATPA